jgi:hypothetical protein
MANPNELRTKTDLDDLVYLNQGWPTRGPEKNSATQSWIETRWFFGILSVFSYSFCQNLAQKSIYIIIIWKCFQMRPRDQFGLATPDLNNISKITIYRRVTKELWRPHTVRGPWIIRHWFKKFKLSTWKFLDCWL